MTRRGVWDIQDVRDKLLAGDPWLRFNNLYTAGINIYGVAKIFCRNSCLHQEKV